MANIFPDIKPTGLNQRDLVCLLRYIVAAFTGLCQKLDADDIAGSNYNTLIYTNIFTVIIEDCWGNAVRNVATQSSSVPPATIIGPKGISDAALLDILYQIHYAFYTLLAKIDADDASTSTYVTDSWNGFIAHRIENRFGTLTGYGSAYYFRPGGVMPQRELVDCLYNFLAAWENMCEQLDSDAKPAGTNYEALWYTTIKLRVENSQGNVIGNTSTHLG